MANDFMRIAYTVDPAFENIESTLKKLSEGGFNLAQSYRWGAQSPEYQQKYLDVAQQYGMQVMPFVYPQRSSQYAGLVPEKQIQALQSYAENPALWGYQIWEEPGGAWELGGKDINPEALAARYQQLKELWPELQYSTTLGSNAWYSLIDPEQYFSDLFILGGGFDPTNPEVAERFLGGERLPVMQALMEQGAQLSPLLQAQIKEGKNFEKYVPLEAQMGVFQQYYPQETWAGASMYKAGTNPLDEILGFLEQPEIWEQVRALNELLGYGGGQPIPGPTPEPEPTPEPTPEPPTPVPEPSPYPWGEWPSAPTIGGETMAQNFVWPYGKDNLSVYEAIGGTRETPGYQTFPWQRTYYPEATGIGSFPMSTVPIYRPTEEAYPTTTIPEGYGGPTAPATFYNPLETPEYPTYTSMGVPETFYEPYTETYPTYNAYTDALYEQLGTTLSQRMAGEGIGMGTESIEYRQGMQQLDAQKAAELEEVERLAAASGRTDAGLIGIEQQAVRDKYAKLKEDFSAQLAIETGKMREQAIQQAITQAPAYTAYGAEQQAQVYESQQQMYEAYERQHELTQEGRERAYGTELAERFREYEAALQSATSAADFAAAQQKLAEEGKTLAWTKATEQYDKAYEYYIQTLKDEDAARQAAWQAALEEYNKLYQSVLTDAQQEMNWIQQLYSWSEQRGQIVLGAHQAAANTWPGNVASLIGGYLGSL